MSAPTDKRASVDPMAALPGHLCPNSRALYAATVDRTTDARVKLQAACNAFVIAKAEVVECQKQESLALAELVAERETAESGS